MNAMPGKPVALVVDDDPAMRDIVTFALETQDFTTLETATAEEAWTVFTEESVDLVVLDVMLPGESGVDLCRRITSTRTTPVILLTALGETADRITGLEAGAADYVAKPFHPRELALRASGLVRRTLRGTGVLKHGSLTLDLRGARALVQDRRVELTGHEVRLLAAFLEHPGEVLTFRTLLLLGWDDPELIGGRELLKTAIYRLRLKIEAEDPALVGLIESVRGVGYRLASVTES